MTLKLSLLFVILVTTCTLADSNSDEYNNNWPAWRGPLATGEAPNADPPIVWSESKNIKWKIQIPEKGLSSPVVWGDQIFITTATNMEEKNIQEMLKSHKEEPLNQKAINQPSTKEAMLQFVVISVSRTTGELNWYKIVNKDFPHEGRHNDGSWASPSCVTDGNLVYSFFGSFGIYCLNMEGKLVWQKDPGDMKIYESFGEGISPVLYDNLLIINWDHQGDSFITALDKQTGETRWLTKRDEMTTWATPLVAVVNDKPQIITTGPTKSRGYDLYTGEQIWQTGNLSMAAIPCPVYWQGMAFLMSGYDSCVIQAINLKNAKGDLENSESVSWTKKNTAPYVPSPLIYKDHLYYLHSNKGQLTCTEPKSGTYFYEKQKLEKIKSVYASPVAANDNIYITGRKGVVYVIQAGPEYKVKAINKLDDNFDASPALVDNDIIFRGWHYLYCIAEN